MEPGVQRQAEQEGAAVFAMVAVPVPVSRGFHYRVPESLRGQVQVGDRVRVPFHGRRLVGTVMRLDDQAAVARVRDVEAVLGPESRLPPDTLELGQWVAETYGASLGEALDAALPPPLRKGRRPRETRRVKLADGVDVAAQVAELDPRYPKQARALRFLEQEGGDASEQELCQLAHVTPSPIRSLARRSLVTLYKAPAVEDPLLRAPIIPHPPPTLTDPQVRAVQAVAEAQAEGRYQGFLLFGVTGSGKTEVYLRSLARTVAQGRQGIVLVPEISLTPQTVSRFRARFSRVAVLHSGLTEAERLWQWRRIKNAEVDVVVGARSAVFAPVPDLGLLILDEEHEASFKQQNPPRYHAREVALHRARMAKAVAILGSATPSLETWVRCEDPGEDGLTRLDLPERVGGGMLPDVAVLDLAHLPFTKNPRLLTDRLRAALRDTLGRGEQAILFLNRRGHSRLLLCQACRETVRCKDCDVTLVLHRRAGRLLCHLCGHEENVRRQCPSCQAPGLRTLGFGTERVEEELREAFPGARVARMDADTTGTRGAHEEILGAFGRQEVDILLGTQMIAKGLDFPHVTLVGIVSADTSLSIPDYRSAERTFQLVAQVAGRAGRSERGGYVVVQTLQPFHPAIQAAVRHDFEQFAAGELEERRQTGYPPYTWLLRILISHEEEAVTATAAVSVCEALGDVVRAQDGTLLGPAPCPIPRVRNRFRYQVLVKTTTQEQRSAIVQHARERLLSARPVRVTLDVDPASLM